MATRLEDEFDPSRINAPDAAYPAGSLKDETTPGVSDDGTPLASRVGNDWQGFSQSVLDKAGIAANGQPDSVSNPQILQAIEQMYNNGDSQQAGGNIWPLSSQESAQVGDDLTGYSYVRLTGGDFSGVELFELVNSDGSGSLPLSTLTSFNLTAPLYSADIDGTTFYLKWQKYPDAAGVVDIRAYGTGTSTDEVAINAIAEMLSNKGSGEILLDVSHTIGAPIVPQTNVGINGKLAGKTSYPSYGGSIITHTSDKGFLTDPDPSKVINWGLRNILFIGPGKNVAGSISVDITHCRHSEIDNVQCFQVQEGFNFSATDGPITFNKFTDIGGSQTNKCVVIDQTDPLIAYNNANLYGFSTLLNHDQIAVEYNDGESNVMKCMGGEIGGTPTLLQMNGGNVTFYGDAWMEFSTVGNIVAAGGFLHIPGMFRMVGKVIYAGGTIKWDCPISPRYLSQEFSLNRAKVRHAYSFRDGSYDDSVGGVSIVPDGTILVNQNRSKYGSSVRNETTPTSRLTVPNLSSTVPITQQWTIGILLSPLPGSNQAAFRLFDSVNDVRLAFSLQDNFCTFRIVDGGSTILTTGIGLGDNYLDSRMPVWFFFTYDPAEMVIKGCSGLTGEGNEIWLDSNDPIDLSSYTGDFDLDLGVATQFVGADYDELIIARGELDIYDIMDVSTNKSDLKSLLS